MSGYDAILINHFDVLTLTSLGTIKLAVDSDQHLPRKLFYIKLYLFDENLLCLASLPSYT